MPDTAVIHSQARPGLGQSLAVSALGVVYGDIGTSPLYTVKQCFENADVSQTRVFGVLSLIAWALTLVVTVKYVLVLLRADNRGEGGILALMVLAMRAAVAGRVQVDHVGRADRGGTILRRWRHYAVDLGAECGGGVEGRNTGF